MGWGAQQWLRATKEATYGAFDGSALPANVHWIRLPTNNPFTMRPDKSKARKVIRSADGGNRRRQVVSARTILGGKLSTLFYPSQADYFLSWASTLASNALTSYTLDYFDTVRARRYLGVMVEQLKVASTAEQDYVTLECDLIGQKQDEADPTLAQPADSVFPTDLPYEHFETKGQVTVGASPVAIVKYKSFNLTIKNVLQGTWDEDNYITALYYCGRDVDYDLDLQYTANTWRPDFEAQTPLTIAAGFARAGTGNTLAMALQAQNYVADLPPEDLPLDNAAYQHVGLQAFYDPTNSTDFSYAMS